MPIRRTKNSPLNLDRVSEAGHKSPADECFDAMVRHSLRERNSYGARIDGEKHPVHAETSTDAKKVLEDEEYVATGDIDLAWGAREVAIAMFGRSDSAAENNRRRRRVFAMYEEYKRALRETSERGKPLPVNPGFVILPRCAAVILSKRAYRSFVSTQLRGRR
jgi:hypothetical protein